MRHPVDAIGRAIRNHPDHYMKMAARIAAEGPRDLQRQPIQETKPILWRMNKPPGPEIWEQMNHRVDAVVCGVGSGGTITGLSRFFARVSPRTEMVLADPQGSALTGYVKNGMPGQQGFVCCGGDRAELDSGDCRSLAGAGTSYSIPDAESFETARDLLRRFGVLGGSSSGCLVAAALRFCREQETHKRVVTFICDTGNKYLSKMYSDYWMIDQGYVERPRTGDLRELLTRRYEEGALITVAPDDPLLTAFQRMRVADVSQVPVIENGQPVGILDESDVLLAVHADEGRFREPVRTAMTSKLETVPVSATLEDVLKVLDAGLVALVMDGGKFLGLITRSDLLAHLRRRLK